MNTFLCCEGKKNDLNKQIKSIPMSFINLIKEDLFITMFSRYFKL